MQHGALFAQFDGCMVSDRKKQENEGILRAQHYRLYKLQLFLNGVLFRVSRRLKYFIEGSRSFIIILNRYLELIN